MYVQLLILFKKAIFLIVSFNSVLPYKCILYTVITQTVIKHMYVSDIEINFKLEWLNKFQMTLDDYNII